MLGEVSVEPECPQDRRQVPDVGPRSEGLVAQRVEEGTRHHGGRLHERVPIVQRPWGSAQDNVADEPSARRRDEPEEHPRVRVSAPRDLPAHDGAPRDRQLEDGLHEELPRPAGTQPLEQPEVPRAPQRQARVHVAGGADPGGGLAAEAGAEGAAAAAAEGGEDEGADGAQVAGTGLGTPEIGGETPGNGARGGKGDGYEKGGDLGNGVFLFDGDFGLVRMGAAGLMGGAGWPEGNVSEVKCGK